MAGVAAKEAERKDDTFCHSDSNRTLSCPDGHFIDIFPGGEYSPLAVFIQDFSCPYDSNRQTALSYIHSGCQREATNLLKRQESIIIMCMLKFQIENDQTEFFHRSP